MSIRTRIFLYTVAFFMVMALLVYGVQRAVIFPSFIRIEHNETAENIRRVMKAIDREVYHLDKLCHDWAQWNDTYSFMVTHSEDYISDNLIYETLKNNSLNLICYFDNSGAVQWGKAYDLEKGVSISIDFLKENHLPLNHPLLAIASASGRETERVKSGVIDTSHGPMVYVSRPILKSDGTGPSRGIITMGRFIHAGMIHSLRDETRVNFNIDYPLNGEKIRNTKNFTATYVEDDFIFFTRTKDEFTDVRTFYYDVYGKPVFTIYYNFPKQVTKQGLASITYALLFFIGAGLVIAVVLIVVLQYKLVLPLQRLTAHASRIEAEGDFSIRLNMDRKDELGTLARSFDTMVQTIHERTEELKTANEQLTRLSQLDGLTGIANRRVFDEFIHREWLQMIREKNPISLILMDVDYFKKFNDLYGHQKGDQCLVAVAGAIRESIHRPKDLGARYGGEEFALVLPNTDEKGALFVAERIRSAVAELRIEHLGSEIGQSVTMSLGLCTMLPQSGDPASQLIKNADEALYLAKKAGRNRVVVFRGFFGAFGN